MDAISDQGNQEAKSPSSEELQRGSNQKRFILIILAAAICAALSVAGVNYGNRIAAEQVQAGIKAADVLACETVDKIDTSNPHDHSALYAYAKVETSYLGKLNSALTLSPPKSPELADAFLDAHMSTNAKLNSFKALLSTINVGETMTEYGRRMRLAGRQYEALRLVDSIEATNWSQVQDLIAVHMMCAATTYESPK